MLYMSVYFQMLSKINPNWDESKGYDENVYNFKVAGFKWIDINHESMRHGGPDARVWDGPFATEKIKGSMISAYKRHAKKIGDTNPVSTQSHKVYRMSFVFGFQQQMLYRLDRWFEQSQEQMDTIPGAALAITEFSEESRRMMYGDHPELDPELIRRRREEEKAARAEMLDRMTPKQRYEFLEKEQREARRQIKRIKYYTPDDSASSRGQHVANSIDLSRKAGSAHAGATRGELA
jgi:hypothetical protein